MGKTVIISDLHADTWTERTVGATGKSKGDLFAGFLDRCAAAGVDRLIINGDIMDFPPYEGFISLGPDAASEPRREVLERLSSFAAVRPVTYILGNHDIGLSGFRSLGVNSFAPLKNVDFCYPDYVLEIPGKAVVLIEHGVFCDPALVLYGRDLLLRTYDDSFFDPIRWKVPGDELPPSAAAVRGAGNAWLMRIMPDDVILNTGESFHDAVAALREGGAGEIIENAFKGLLSKLTPRESGDYDSPDAGGGIIDEITSIFGRAEPVQHAVKWWWKRHAYERMKKYMSTASAAPPVIAQVFGHTHLPHINEGEIDGVRSRYFNIGTWRGDTDLCTYLVVDDSGDMRLHDWAADADDARGL